MDDGAIAETSGLVNASLNGQLMVVTEASYGAANGAFLLEASGLPAFISNHLSKY